MVRSWTKVFSFVFRHGILAKGYLTATFLVTALLLAVIPACFVLLSGDGGEELSSESTVQRAIIVESDDTEAFGLYSPAAVSFAENLEEAISLAEGHKNTVIVVPYEDILNVLIPEGSYVTEEDAQALGDSLGALAYAAKHPYEITEEPAEDLNGASTAREIIGFVIPYVTLMLMYFMVLFYSQGVANSAIVEKTSKLMDLFLVSIKPAAVMLGKTLAIALTGIIQVVMWFAGAAGGVAIGAMLVENLHPESAIIAVLDSLGGLASIFSPATVIAAIAMIITGFLMYCALSAVGGALASRPEELSTTNTLFTMALLISFLLCMFSGSGGGMISTDRWMNFVPFTAILVVPGRLLTGTITPWEAFVSIGITAAFAFGLILLAGKAYTLTAFYRGEAIKPVKFIKGLVKHKN